MNGRPREQLRRICPGQAAASLCQLEALFWNPKKDNPSGKAEGVGKAENSENTLPQSAIELQGAPK